MKVALLILTLLLSFGWAAFDGGADASVCCIGRCSSTQSWSSPSVEVSMTQCMYDWRDYCGRVTAQTSQLPMSSCPY